MATYVPYIDPNVEHVGVSKLRSLNAKTLRNNDKTFVIQDNNTPLAVLLTYDQFQMMQKQLEAVLETIEVLNDDEERHALIAGLEAVSAGRTRSLSEIRAALKARHGKRKD
jgi:PHD/YefM family antitoxin component YafN of YafNO toxin-antitoxin module